MIYVKVGGRLVRGQQQKRNVAREVKDILADHGIQCDVKVSHATYSDRWLSL